jgi:hypothetical protein
MIVIKTDMPEMPEGCAINGKWCDGYIRERRNGCTREWCICGKKVSKKDMKIRPEWCPLVEVKEDK